VPLGSIEAKRIIGHHVDLTARMSSHGIVRDLIKRLAAMILAGLLAGSSVATCQPALDAERDASGAQDSGLNAPRGPTASAVVSVAPAARVATLAATARVDVAFYPLVCGRLSNLALRPAIALKAAPTILRI